jgi:circadian clock protein KaiC
MKSLGWDAADLMSNGFELMYQSPVEMQLDTVTNELFRRVRERQIKRVVIDAFGDLERTSVDHRRSSDFIYSLTQWFATQNVTCLMTYEMSNLFEVHGISNHEVSNMADNVLLLRFREGQKIERTVRVIKTRGSAHDNSEYVLEITARTALS